VIPICFQRRDQIMKLLTRIAISNGDKARKASANLLIVAMEADIIQDWNDALEKEIEAKTRKRRTSELYSTEQSVGLIKSQDQLH
jgi:hypothetical protein